MPATAQQLLDALVSAGKLTKDQATAINTESISTAEAVEDILKRKHVVSDIDIAQARAKTLGIPFVSLSTRAISPDVVGFIPEPVARRYTLAPFAFDAKTNELSIAMLDPLDFQVIEFLEKKSGKTIKPFMAMQDDILTTMEDIYTQNLGADVTAALREAPTEVRTYEAGHLGEVIREAPIAQIVSAILEQAMRLRASDVHIEPQLGDTRVRYRIDGILQERLA
ncbi:hypothetical protein HY031_01530, partial [Candidatus Gottesmanbacteria bacterium]|nr:hypothetical protein [Candidatus Gottesmanbacteria bacterium]